MFVMSFVYCVVIGQSLQTLRPPPYLSLNTYSLKHVDAGSMLTNQAALTQVEGIEIALYGERRFFLNELNLYQLAAAFGTRYGNFGVSARYFGGILFNEALIGLAYARRFGVRVDIGIQFNYNGMGFAGYGKSSAVGFEIGSIFHLSEKLHAGIRASNPIETKYGPGKLRAIYSMGFGYETSDKFLVSIEFNKETNAPINIIGGFQYQMLPSIHFKMGVSTGTTSYWMGTGIFWKSCRIDVTSSYNPQLGISPGILLAIKVNKRSAEKVDGADG